MHFSNYGLLPDFTSATSNPLLASYLNQLNGAMQTAMQTQATIAPLLLRPEGATLAGVVSGLESSIANAWQRLQNDTAAHAQAQQAQVAQAQTPQPKQSDYQYSGGAGWYQQAVQDWTAKVQAATANVTAAENNAMATKNELIGLLAQYNDRVPTAAKLVTNVVNAGLVAQAADTNHAAAVSTYQATTAATQVAQASVQLITAQKAATAAISAINDPPLPWAMIAGGVAVVAVIGIAIYMRKRKSASMSGYRRRGKRKSRKIRR